MTRPPTIRTKEQVKAKMALLEVSIDINHTLQCTSAFLLACLCSDQKSINDYLTFSVDLIASAVSWPVSVVE